MRTRAAGIAALWCALLVLAIASPARGADAYFGGFSTNYNAAAAQADGDMNAQAATGIGLLREHIYWDQIERSPGAFDFTKLDALVARASSRGMTVLPILTSTPAFYSTRPAGVTTDGWPPTNPASIYAFSYQLTKRYGARGTYWGCLLPGLFCQRTYRPITAWEVWNEPDTTAWWRTGPDPAAYLPLLRNAYQGLRAGDPAAEVVLGGLSFRALTAGGFLERLYDLGAAPYFDTLALHPYAANVSGVVAYLQRALVIAVSKNDANVQLRATEFGFATGGTSAWTTTVPCQAALIAATTRELYARRTELRLRSIIQLQWRDRVATPDSWPNHAGLLFADGTAKPALAAFTRAVHGMAPLPGTAVADVCPVLNQG